MLTQFYNKNMLLLQMMDLICCEYLLFQFLQWHRSFCLMNIIEKEMMRSISISCLRGM